MQAFNPGAALTTICYQYSCGLLGLSSSSRPIHLVAHMDYQGIDLIFRFRKYWSILAGNGIYIGHICRVHS
ncbi:hypothetical protein DAI22_04g280100 [Oryza sativa Japonica Group]|nr:hypothetical protein DAI22_04g280100 [Oryza sativa Japonica Group]